MQGGQELPTYYLILVESILNTPTTIYLLFLCNRLGITIEQQMTITPNMILSSFVFAQNYYANQPNNRRYAMRKLIFEFMYITYLHQPMYLNDKSYGNEDALA